MIRLCLTGPFEKDDSPPGLVDLLLGATDLPDIKVLEAHLKETRAEVAGIFDRLLGPDAEAGSGQAAFAVPAGRRDRDAHRDDGADALRRADLQRAAMQLGQRARDRQPETGAGVALRELVLHLLEGPSELGQSARFGMPQPLSSMVSMSAPATLRARTEIWPPSPVNFTALDRRLMAICLIARRSA